VNIDGLHKRAGSKQVIEVHGSLDTVLCTRCKKAFPFSYIAESMYCPDCNSLLRPDVVLYGEMIPKFYEAIEVIGSADELIVVGTSFYTSTATDLVGSAKAAGIKVKTINSNAEVEIPRYLDSLL
jgi:NAD-dependent deacetylase